ncbi:TetR/AcrR family transcriptional regulator [Paenarthrobacter sp. OM7]|uniref:TetR/AcrR family transcriptional regulator n=1 Tax=Paenarthrobacter sp. OM7 TaxID=3041264 RepID=UPI00246977FA|nr:TetR/AcrR family transcriptional regulator [Paenarthrobacter sp. OM7]WGM20312.1 TetR/AcrR family transcriptional regulator [Paenarthrobacter sp. OM7]
MSMREQILATARQLAISTGSIPSMDAVAAAAKVSKGGFTHHFRTKAALLEGLAVQAIESLDEALNAAVTRGNVVETWLRISKSQDDADLYRALLVSFTDLGENADGLLSLSAEASKRWEQLLAAELGDPVAASIVRLLGDGMVMNSLTREALPPVENILTWLEPRRNAE